MTTFQLGEKENELLHSIYAAALAPEKWRSVIEAIAAHIGVDNALLLFSDSSVAGMKLLQMAGASDGNATTSAAINLDTNEIKELFKFPHGNTLVLSAEASAFLQRLVPHIAKALHIYNQINAARNTNASLVESLKCSHLGVLLLDDHLQVGYVTAGAKHILEKNPALHINRFEQLEIRDNKQHLQLDEQLRQLLLVRKSSSAQSDTFSMPVRTRGKAHPIKLTAMVLDKQQGGVNKFCIAIFLNDPEQMRLIPQDYLQQAFELTRTEGAIAQLLLNGCSVAEVASIRKTTLETTRWQLKSILHKTNTSTQAELTRMLMLLSHDVANTSLIIDQPAIHSTEAIHTTHMGDD